MYLEVDGPLYSREMDGVGGDRLLKKLGKGLSLADWKKKELDKLSLQCPSNPEERSGLFCWLWRVQNLIRMMLCLGKDSILLTDNLGNLWGAWPDPSVPRLWTLSHNLR